MLGDLWYCAWQQAPPDAFLKSSLTRRQLGKEASPAKKKARQ
jgi:hypothetical protein